MSNIHKHPNTEAELLLYADGELDSHASRRVSSHLEGCPSCLEELADRECVHKTFTQLRNTLIAPAVFAPPNGWKSLDSKIDAWENQRQIGSILGYLHGIARPGFALAAGLILALIIIFLRPWQETVSANEVLNRAMMSQRENFRLVQAAVVHQTLQICRRSATGGGDIKFTYESWRNPSGQLLREISSSEEMAGELQRVFRANRLDWNLTQSAAAYERWRSSLAQKRDSVSHANQGQLALTTVAGGQGQEDAIHRAQLVVRSSDWRPVTMKLWLRSFQYEITEVNLEPTPISQSKPLFLEAPANLSGQPKRMATSAAKAQRVVHNMPAFSVLKPLSEVGPGNAVSPVSIPASGPDSPDSNRQSPAQLPDSPKIEKNDQLSIALESVPLPSAPAPAPGITITFSATRRDNLTQPLPGAKFSPPTPPSLFPVPAGIPEHRNHLNTEPFKALASRLGLIKKKKTEPADPAKPGG